MTSISQNLALLSLLAVPCAAQTPMPVLDQHDLSLAMARIASEHPKLVTVVAVGTSRANRRIEGLRFPADTPDPGRPGVLIVANVDGPLVWTSSLALDHARVLAERYATDEKVKALLDTTTIYIVPRADPDAAEARFAKPLFEERASGTGVDDDRDGRQGEDPPRDVDGDGLVTWMRVPSPDGEWTSDPADERATIKADHAKGQRGKWKLVREGRDADGDGVASEDQELDAVVNRNFPAGWEEHGHDSGRFATDEPEAKALCDFIVSHKEIALVITYGELDNVVDKPRVEGKVGRQSALPSSGIPEADADVYAQIGKRFKDLGRGAKGDAHDAGTFQAWVQAQRGLWTIDIAPWSIPLDEPDAKKAGDAAPKDGQAADPGAKTEPKGNEAKTASGTDARSKPDDASKPDATPPKTSEPSDGKAEARSDAPADAKRSDRKPRGKPDDDGGPSDDAKRLRWIDAHQESARFVAWHAFHHPELGDVEIGGFAPYALVEPPEADRADIAKKDVEFVIDACGDLARLKVVEAVAKDLGNGLWKVDAVLLNDGYFPFPSALGRRTREIRPARVTLELPKEAQVLQGDKQTLVRELAGSGGRKDLHWLVHGAPPSAMKIVLDSDMAGTGSVVPEVK